MTPAIETPQARVPALRTGRRRTFRTAVMVGPRRFELQEIETPEPGPGQVRVRLEGCGVCGSNLPVWEGRPWFSYPLEPGGPGHEGWGIVDEVGPNVRGIGKGQRVALLGQHSFAEMEVCDANLVFRIPQALAEHPVPGEALGCAYNVFARSRVTAGQTVAVVGVGFLGALLVGLCSSAGARVCAITRRSFAGAVAARMGAHEVLPMENHETVAASVRSLTQDRGCDVVIECTGAQDPLTLASDLVAERGRLVVAGYHQDGSRQVNMQRWNWNGIDVINAHERDPRVYLDGIASACGAIVQGRMNPMPLYTHLFRLDEISEAFETLQARPDGFMKALIVP